ncbi:Werner Syndrome-like exonuclease [Chelonus insularis]|uniref:Werner Syndrome-like exonuclease n=1 Tax=Chelonus insularis TaxID=460826 RepID=UPI00158AA1A2|nr:Werner Syndrome-like exonuclease [Chelonus insularis]
MTNRTTNFKYEKDNIIEGRTIKRLLRSSSEADKKALLQNDLVTQREPDVQSLPPIVFTGKIYFVTSFEDCAMICAQVIERIEKHTRGEYPIGFDLEWPFSYQTGAGKTALAQLCVSEHTCHLLHLYNLTKLPQSFINLLKHPRIRIVGVNIKNDIWKLGRDFPEFPAQRVVKNNCIECGVLANQVYNRSCRWSLQRLTAFILHRKINKDKEVRVSKWHILPLSTNQKKYAATDAYVSLLVYLTIKKKADEIRLEKEKNGREKLITLVTQTEALKIMQSQ